MRFSGKARSSKIGLLKLADAEKSQERAKLKDRWS
jgi:hypothetical protein